MQTNLQRSRHETGGVDELAVTHVVDGLAGELAFEAASSDAAVAWLVLCTVPDVGAALADLRRVIRPDGELRFYERVLAREPRYATFQRAVTRSGAWPLWRAAATPTATRPRPSSEPASSSRGRRRFHFRSSVLAAPAAPRILGVARRGAKT